MGMRSAVFDNWLTKQLSLIPDATVLHMGCGQGIVQLTEDRPMFNAGTVGPHGTLTYTVCEQNALPGPDYGFSYEYSPDGAFMVGIDSWAHVDIYSSTMWWPILDYGDYLTELPEEEEEQP